jgi:uncharacterized protein (TIGR00369 family)
MRAPEERRYAFETATIDRRLGRELSGLELLRRIRDGELPTAAMAQTLAFRFAEVEPGRVVVEGEAGRFVYNMWGIAHGGWAAALLDTCMGCAVSTTVPKGSGYTTVDLTINYVRPARAETGLVRAEGRVLHAGRRTATAEGRLVAASDGRLLAHGLTTCLIFEVGPDDAAGP